MDEIGNLLKAARVGDAKSTETLVGSQLDRLYRIAFRVSGDRHLAEDIVQEVFIRILHGRSVCRRAEAASSWLSRITVRVALDQIRDQAARRRREEKYAMAREGVSPGGVMGTGRMGAEDLEILSEALASLPADGRACLWLHFAEGMNVRQVAAHIGKGKSATATRIREAAEHVRTFLGKRGFSLGLAIPIPDLLRGLPEPAAASGLSERIQEAARCPKHENGETRDWLASFTTGAVAIMTGKKIAAVAITLALLILAGWGGSRLFERPGAGGQQDTGGPPPIAGKEPAPSPAAPIAVEEDSAPAVASSPAPAENHAPVKEKPTTLKGQVVDLDDLPIPGCKVHLRKQEWDLGRMLEAETDEEGAFEFKDLEAGRYTAIAWDPRHAPAEKNFEFPGEAEVALRLPPAAFVRARIFLLDASMPLRKGEVSISDGRGPELGYSEAPLVLNTDTEGRVFIGPYCRSHDWGEHILTFQHGLFKAETRHVTIDQDAGSKPDLEVVLNEGITVKGMLRNLQGASIAGVDINWRKPGSNMSTQLKCTTDARGRFERTGLEPGHQIAAVKSVAPEFKIEVEVELGEEPLQEVNLTVDCLPALEIRVENREGKPVSGVQVQYSYSMPGGSGGSSSTPTDDEGRTTLLCVQIGLPLKLELEPLKAPGTIHASYTATPATTSIVLRLEPQIKLSGEVLDADQKPAAKVAVSVVRIEQHRIVPNSRSNKSQSGVDGGFEFILPPGDYRVAAQGGIRGASTARFSIEEGVKPEKLRIELSTEKAVLVRVTGPDEKPIAGAELELWPMERKRRREMEDGRSDEAGWISFPAEPGTYSISANQLPPGLSLPNAITGVPAGGPPVEVRLVGHEEREEGEERTVSGVVLHDGQPVPKANVAYWRVNGGWYGGPNDSFCTSNDQGKFELTKVNARTIRVIAWGPGFAMARSELLELPERGKVEGIIVASVSGKDFRSKFLDPDGKPFPHLRVSIGGQLENDPFSILGVTDQEGILRIPNLPPGDYNLRSETPDNALALWQHISWDGQGNPPEFQLKKNRP